ncbi:MAG: immunity 17 family protein [Bacteroidaceae bacterium]|nr:immunity 17 family protein [Bacteroidaceae bacterium]
MAIHYIIQVLFGIVGAATLAAALFDHDWLFESKNAEYVVRLFERRKSRIFYGAVGVLFIAIAIFFFFHIRATIK